MILITNIKYNKILIKINDLYCCMNVINYIHKHYKIYIKNFQ